MGIRAPAQGLDAARVGQRIAVAHHHGRGIFTGGTQRVLAAVGDPVIIRRRDAVGLRAGGVDAPGAGDLVLLTGGIDAVCLGVRRADEAARFIDNLIAAVDRDAPGVRAFRDDFTAPAVADGAVIDGADAVGTVAVCIGVAGCLDTPAIGDLVPVTVGVNARGARALGIDDAARLVDDFAVTEAQDTFGKDAESVRVAGCRDTPAIGDFVPVALGVDALAARALGADISARLVSNYVVVADPNTVALLAAGGDPGARLVDDRVVVAIGVNTVGVIP